MRKESYDIRVGFLKIITWWSDKGNYSFPCLILFWNHTHPLQSDQRSHWTDCDKTDCGHQFQVISKQILTSTVCFHDNHKPDHKFVRKNSSFEEACVVLLFSHWTLTCISKIIWCWMTKTSLVSRAL